MISTLLFKLFLHLQPCSPHSLLLFCLFRFPPFPFLLSLPIVIRHVRCFLSLFLYVYKFVHLFFQSHFRFPLSFFDHSFRRWLFSVYYLFLLFWLFVLFSSTISFLLCLSRFSSIVSLSTCNFRIQFSSINRTSSTELLKKKLTAFPISTTDNGT